MDTGDWIQLAGMAIATIIAIAGQTLVVVKYLLGQIERERLARVRDSEMLHGRVNDVRETFVRRDDLMLHIERLERGQAESLRSNTEQHTMLGQGLERLHERIDNIILREALPAHSRAPARPDNS